MKITEFINENLILTGLAARDKAGLLGAMVDHLIAKGVIEASRRELLTGKLMEREALSSTGIGGGVAIPHASGERVERMVIAAARLANPVDFDAIDGQPVRLVFMIIASERAPREHLQLLAAIVRALKNEELTRKLLAAKTPRQAFEALAAHDAKGDNGRP